MGSFGCAPGGDQKTAIKWPSRRRQKLRHESNSRTGSTPIFWDVQVGLNGLVLPYGNFIHIYVTITHSKHAFFRSPQTWPNPTPKICGQTDVDKSKHLLNESGSRCSSLNVPRPAAEERASRSRGISCGRSTRCAKWQPRSRPAGRSSRPPVRF